MAVTIEIIKDRWQWRIGRKHTVNEGVAEELIRRGIAKYENGNEQSNAGNGSNERTDNADASKEATRDSGLKHTVNEGVAEELIKRGIAKYENGNEQSNASDSSNERADNADTSQETTRNSGLRNSTRRSHRATDSGSSRAMGT